MRLNHINHVLAFADVEDFDWSVALIQEDRRFDYGERRFRAMSYLNARFVVLIYTMRGDMCRVILLYKANKREVKYYEQAR